MNTNNIPIFIIVERLDGCRSMIDVTTIEAVAEQENGSCIICFRGGDSFLTVKTSLNQIRVRIENSLYAFTQLTQFTQPK